MSNIGRSEVIRVHLFLELHHRGIHEQRWVGNASAAPNDIWGRSSIPCGSLLNHTSTCLRSNEIRADEMKSLIKSCCCGLYHRQWSTASVRKAYRGIGKCLLQFLNISSNENDAGTFPGQCLSDAFSHALGGAGHKYCLLSLAEELIRGDGPCHRQETD